MYTEEQLIEFNNQLLQRGAPVERDGIGYNKPDFVVCNSYYDILTDTQTADLSQRLIKYCSTQLGIDKEKMKETANYYNSKITNESLDNAISIQPGKDMTLISFTYNHDFIAVVKQAKNRKYNPEIKKWFVANGEVITILEKLQKIGADCKNAIEYLKENLVINEQKEVSAPAPKQSINTITVNELKNGKLEIGFNYNPEIVAAIKSLNDRKYNPTSKKWTIEKDGVNTLINKLQNIPNVDISQLFNFKIEEVKQEVIELMDYSFLQRKPFHHQLEAAKFLINSKKVILADEMGGGKTLSSILATNQITGKKLVICPASLKLNWQKEIRYVSNDNIAIINGKGWINSEGWTIINYDILCKHVDSILNGDFKVVIMDECHYIKAVTNSGKPGSKRAGKALEIADKVEYVFMLTGTPITNKTKDIFNTLKSIKHPLSKNFFAFGNRYCDAKHNGYGWDFNGSSNQAELNQRLQGFMIRRLKVDLLDLPEKIRSFIPVSINLKEYNSKINEYMAKREGMEKGKQLVLLNAMRHLLTKEKVTHTIEQVNNLLEQDQQVVVFTCFNFVVEKLMQEFGNSAVKLTGDCNQKQRQEAVDQFQAGKKQVIVCNIVAGGVGITLTASQTVIFNDFDWVPANHAQAEDRIHRIGQVNKCNIIYMYAYNTFDEKAANILEVKLNNISQIVDGKEESFLNELIKAI